MIFSSCLPVFLFKLTRYPALYTLNNRHQNGANMRIDPRIFLLIAATLSTAGCPTNSTSSGATPNATRPRPPRATDDPLVLVPAGWTSTPVSQIDDPGHRQTVFTPAGSSCRVTLDAWPSLPSSDGGVMQVASSREVVVDGKKLRVLTTAIFQGIGERVEALFVNDGHAHARAVFGERTPAEVDAVLASARLSAAVKAKP